MPDSTPGTLDDRPDAATMRGVIPYIGLGGRAGEAADFYTRAFGARELGRHAVESNPTMLLHVHLELNGGALMLTDCHDPQLSVAPQPQGFHLQLVVSDMDAWWSRATKAGCGVVMPLELQFWGDRWGMLSDPFGLNWAMGEAAQ